MRVCGPGAAFGVSPVPHRGSVLGVDQGQKPQPDGEVRPAAITWLYTSRLIDGRA